MRLMVSSLLVLSLAGCQALSPAATGNKPKPKANQAAATSTTPTAAVRFAPLSEPHRPLDLAVDLVAKTKLVTVELTGKAKLLSDHGAGIISNNTGGLLSDHGAGIVSNQGGSLVSNNSGSLVSNNSGSIVGKSKLRLLADNATAPGGRAIESPLAEAQIEFLDGAGHVLVGPDDQPIIATTDNEGNFSFRKELPDENLIARVRLFNGGQLQAMLPRSNGQPRTLSLDTAATLGAAYVLENYVQKRPDVFAKLPEAEVTALQTELEAARGELPATLPTYQIADMVAAAGELGKKVKPVAERFERIRALLLAGQANLGAGRKATQVSLSSPTSVLQMPDGSYIIAECGGAKIRRVAPDGTVGLFAGFGFFFNGREVVEVPGDIMENPVDMVRRADGSIVVSDTLSQRVRLIAPDGRVSVLLGTGKRDQGPDPSDATRQMLAGPRGLALGPDGTLWISELPKSEKSARILHMKADNSLEIIPGPVLSGGATVDFSSLIVAPDGTIYAADAETDKLMCKRPGADWQVFDEDAGMEDFSGMAFLPNGDLLAASVKYHRVWRYTPAGQRSVFAGSGTAGYTPDGAQAVVANLNGPVNVMVQADGRVVIVEGGNNLVRRVEADGSLFTIAGTTASSQVGDATQIAVAGPSGLAIDAQGRLLLTEISGNTVKRLDGLNLTVLAGDGTGFSGDGGPAKTAKFNTLSSIATKGDDIYVADTSNNRIRVIDASGKVDTLVGEVLQEPQARRMKPLATHVGRIVAVAFSPDGTMYWVDNSRAQVCRLVNGTVEVVVGTADAKEGDAPDTPTAAYSDTSGKLSVPLGLAFDPDGNLYICDSGNMKIRKVTGLNTETPMMETFAGKGLPAILRLVAGEMPRDEGGPAREASLLLPAMIAIDQDGTCYFSEAGTFKLAAVGGMAGFTVDNLPRVTARIRKIGKDGKIHTVAGWGTSLLGDFRTDDALVSPIGLVFDREGRLVIADAATNQIRVLPKSSL